MAVKQYRTDGQTFWLVDEWIYVNGKRTRFRKWRIPTRESADALAAKVKIESFEGRYFDRRQDSRATLADVWDAYRPHSERRKGNHQARIYLTALAANFKGRPVISLKPADFEAWRRAELQRVTLRGRKVSPGTVDLALAYAKAALNHAVRTGLIPSNPWRDVPSIAAPNARSHVFTEESLRKVLSHLPDFLHSPVVLAYETGMRIGEVMRLEWSRVDLQREVIHLGALDTKGRRARTIPLSPRALELLRHTAIRGPLVFPSPRKPGRPIRNPYAAWTRARNAAGLPGAWIHDLRRTWVTRARRAGVPETVVMKLSGHATNSVFRRYSIVEESDLFSAVRQLASAGTVSGHGPTQEAKSPGRGHHPADLLPLSPPPDAPEVTNRRKRPRKRPTKR